MALLTKRHAYPTIGQLAIAEIKPSHIHDLLKPIWVEKRETATVSAAGSKRSLRRMSTSTTKISAIQPSSLSNCGRSFETV